MKKHNCRRVLAGALAVAFAAMNLPSVVVGELHAVGAQSDDMTELAVFSQQVNALTAKDTPDAYYGTLTIQAGQDTVLADGEACALGADAKMENGVLTVSERFLYEMMGVKPAQGATVQSDCRVPLQETAEAMGYTVVMTENGAELQNRFQTARLIVKAKGSIDSLGAVDAAEGYNDLHIFSYETPAAAFAAYQAYQEMDGVEYVEPSVYLQAAQMDQSGDAQMKKLAKEALAEVTAIQGEHYSWGADTIQVDTFTDHLLSSMEVLPEVVVAVIDTGVDYNHPWFEGRLADNGANFVDNGNALPQDDFDHGTHVSGTICDLTPNNVKILPIKTLDSSGSGSTEQIYCGMVYANESGADVVNMSLGGLGSSYLMEEAVEEGTAQGIIYCIASGNDSMCSELFSPGNVPDAITVGAVDINDEAAYFTNYGSTVDISAPGVDIISAELNGDTISMSGTSMATPHVAASCALLRTADDTLTADEALQILAANAVDLGDPGYDVIYGYGRLSMDFTGLYTERCADPVISVEGGEYDDAQTVTITAEDDAQIYYTTDSSQPSAENGTLYTEPLEISQSTILRAIAVCEGKNSSSVVSATYFIGGQDVPGAFEVVDGTLVRYKGVRTSLDLSEYEETAEITHIGESAFASTGVVEVLLPDSVTDIADSAFENCTGLISIAGSGVVHIGNYAFSGCSILQSVTFAPLESAGDYSFASTQVSELDLGTMTVIPEGMFCGNSQLNMLNAPDVTAVKAYAFQDCYRFMAEYYLSLAELTEIGDYAFAGSSLYGDMAFDSLTTLGSYAFADTGITSVSLPETVTELPDGTFYNCGDLTYVSAPGATKIGATCFAAEDDVNEGRVLDLNWEKITEIGMGAFFGQFFSDEISLSSLKTLDENAFLFCSFTTISLPTMTELPAGGFLLCSADVTILGAAESFGMDDVPLSQYYVVGPDCTEIRPSELIDQLDVDRMFIFIGESGSYVETFANEMGFIFEPAPYVYEAQTEYSCYQYDELLLRANVLGLDLAYQWMTADTENGSGTALDGETSSVFSVPTDATGTAYYWCEVTALSSGKTIETDPFTVTVEAYSAVELAEGDGIEIMGLERSAFLFTPETDGLYGCPYLEYNPKITVMGPDLKTTLACGDYVELTGGTSYTFLVDFSEAPEYNYFVIRSKENAAPNTLQGAWVDCDAWQYAYVPGEVIVPEVRVYYGETLLTEGVDYTAHAYSNEAPGTAHIYILGMGDYEGSFVCDYMLVQALTFDESERVELVGDEMITYSYTPETDGRYILSAEFATDVDYDEIGYDALVSVYTDDEFIGEFDDSDYSLLFEAGMDLTAGVTYYFDVSAYARYGDENATIFNIRMVDDTFTCLSGASVYASDTEYTGEIVIPALEVWLDETLLEAGVDYVVIPDMNTVEGYAYARINGIGSYYGVIANVEYYIGNSTDISEDFDFVGEIIENEPLTLNWDGKASLYCTFVPSESTYYSFAFDGAEEGYSDISFLVFEGYESDGKVEYAAYHSSDEGYYCYLNADMPYAVRFEYYGADAESEVLVTPKRMLEHAEVYAENFVYTGESIEPEFEVYYEDELLEEGVDYYAEWDTVTAPGSYLIDLYGIGAYRGSNWCYYTVSYNVDADAPVLTPGNAKVELTTPGEAVAYQFTSEEDATYLLNLQAIAGIRLSVFDSDGMPVLSAYENQYLYCGETVFFPADETYYITIAAADPSWTGEFDLTFTNDYVNMYDVVCDYSSGSVLTYTGSFQIPEFCLMNGDEQLVEGVDYVITDVMDGVEIGTHNAFIRGIGRCYGTTMMIYAIAPETMDAEVVAELIEDEVVDVETGVGDGALYSFTAEKDGYYGFNFGSLSNYYNALYYDEEMNPMPYEGGLQMAEGETVYLYLHAYEMRGVDTAYANLTVFYYGVSDETQLGDVNFNGEINTDDAVVILKTYAEITISGEPAPEEIMMYGDVNFDGKIDSDDAVGILKVYANYLITGEIDWSVVG